MHEANTVRQYLADTGWRARDLARRARVHESALSHILAGRRRVGRLVALELDRATRAAYDAGETSVPPLRLANHNAARTAA